jgi:hypothetical protein
MSKEKRGGGAVAQRRVEEESVGGGDPGGSKVCGRWTRWPIRHLPREAGERVVHVGHM